MKSLRQFQTFLFFFTERFHTHQKAQKVQKVQKTQRSPGKSTKTKISKKVIFFFLDIF